MPTLTRRKDVLHRGDTLAPGSYIYELTIESEDLVTSTICTDVASVQVTVHNPPTPPVVSSIVGLSCTPYEMQLTATHSSAGEFNWSNGYRGAVNTVLEGGPYRVWYTDEYGCRSHTDVSVPYAPDRFFPYFPSGCYELCSGQEMEFSVLPSNLWVAYWQLLKNNMWSNSGWVPMPRLVVDAPGTYELELGNSYCVQKSPPMVVNEKTNCGDCSDPLGLNIVPASSIVATCTYTSSGAGTYSVNFNVISPGPGPVTPIRFGTNLGPVAPFEINLVPGTHNVTLSMTSNQLPPPATAKLYVYMPNVDYHNLPPYFFDRCSEWIEFSLPSCSWAPQRRAPEDISGGDAPHLVSQDAPGWNVMAKQAASDALLVYPNPAQEQVFINYQYGDPQTRSRHIAIYDLTGREVLSFNAAELQGKYEANISVLASGTYLIRMEADGQTLLTQKLVITR